MPSGLATAYDLTVGVPINMDEAIYMISPNDAPLINGLNSDGLQILPVMSLDEKEFSWMDEERLTPRSTVTGLALASGAATLVGVATGERERFATGDIITIVPAAGSDELEVMQVSAWNGATDLIEVVRNFVTTAAAGDAYTAADEIIGIGQALAEGSAPEDARTIDRNQRTNYTQIFGPTKMSMSRTEQNRRKYGVANEFTHQLGNRLVEMTIARDQAFLLGRKFEDSSNKKRTTGGIAEWISSNVTDTTTLNVTTIQTMMQTNYDNGGVPDILSANPKVLGTINELADTGRTRVTFEDVRRGRTPVRYVETEFGTITVTRNRHCPTSLAVGWQREQATRRVFDPVIMRRMAVVGDSDDVFIVCEEGLEFKGESHAFKFTALT